MWQAEIRVDLGAIRQNVARLRSGTTAEVMAVVKADGYGHGMVPVARAALDAGATWLGACTVDEALALRAAGIEAPVLAWLLAPGMPLEEAVRAGVDLSTGSLALLGELVAAARELQAAALQQLERIVGEPAGFLDGELEALVFVVGSHGGIPPRAARGMGGQAWRCCRLAARA